METVHASNARYPDWYPSAPVMLLVSVEGSLRT
jgi:hypothetical protein